MGKKRTIVDRVLMLKIQLEHLWQDRRLRAPFGPVFWHDNPERYGGYDESAPLPLFYRAGKWTPNRSRRRRKPKP